MKHRTLTYFSFLRKQIDNLVLLRSYGRFIADYSELNSLFSNDDGAIVTYVNPHVMSVFDFSQMLPHKNWYLVADGNSMAYFLSKILETKCATLNFDDSGIAFKVLRHGLFRDEPTVVLGGTKSDAISFERRLRESGINSKCFDGYSADLNHLFVRSEASLKLISIGSPLQELFIINNFQNLKKTSKFIFTSGGFVSQFARATHSIYPALVVRLKLRFAYRAFRDRGVLKRLIFIYPFVYLAFILKLTRK